MYIIRVLLCVLMFTEVSVSLAETVDFITVSELNKARKKKSFVDVDHMLNRKGLKVKHNNKQVIMNNSPA